MTIMHDRENILDEDTAKPVPVSTLQVIGSKKRSDTAQIVRGNVRMANAVTSAPA
jgi:hypothetical protein